jgi:hypothetical protein
VAEYGVAMALRRESTALIFPLEYRLQAEACALAVSQLDEL